MRARTGREKHYHFVRYYYMHKSDSTRAVESTLT